MTSGDDRGQLLARYIEVLPLYQEWARRLDELLKSLLAVDDIEHLCESRAKDPTHFLEKAGRPGKQYTDPLAEITDLAGARVIVESPSAVEQVAQIIREEFEVDEVQSMDKADLLKVDQFGYRSQHFIVRLRAPRGTAREWSQIAGLWAEIQVRTALQHAWAQVEHGLVYKPDSDLPPPLRRRFNALAAVFELADRELDELIEAGRQLIREEKSSIDASEGDVELTTLSLIAYMEDSSVVRTLLDMVRQEGVEIGPVGLADRAVVMATHAGIRTVRELDQMLIASLPWARDFFRLFFGYEWEGVDRSRTSFDVSGVPTVLVIAARPDAFDKETLEGRFGFGGSWRVTRAAEEAQKHADRS